ncbi:MAG: oligoendopeptidase F, partial [Anaerolineae bacterium]|nr:oligoendopeptidase F [Anaerolineae bacterium]
MVDATLEQKTGAETIVWDLSIFYSGPDDPAIETDIAALNQMVDAFVEQYRGRIADLDAQGMLAAVDAMETLMDKAYRLGMYANLLYTTDTNNAQYGALIQR